MNAKQKYLKDESGQVISPVVSTETVYDASGNTLGGGIIPIGGILPYVGETAPLNYLLCDGSVYNTSDYPELSYLCMGVESDVFNVPDLKSRVPVGYDPKNINSGMATHLFTEGGETSHTLTINEMPSHQHKLISAGGDTMAVMTNRVHSNDIDQHSGGIWTYDQVSMNTNWVGGTQAHNNMQPFIVLNYIIRAK